MNWNMQTALDQIQSCGFECEGGPLSNNVAWRWLVDAAANGPEFYPGQRVWYEVKTTVAGVPLSGWSEFTVVGCQMDSDTERTIFHYDLSNDPPGPWHYGKISFPRVAANLLRVSKP
jgi:hypothetical protein